MKFREGCWTWLIAGLVLLPCASPALVGGLEYDRQAVARGELWRLATCHFVHFGGDHLAWNLVGLVVLGLACEQRGRSRYVACTLAGGLSISVALLVLDPGLSQYRGYSGVASSVFTSLGIQIMLEARRNGRPAWTWLIAVVFASFVVKLQFEQMTGRAFFAQAASAEMEPVPLAHTVGALAGLVCSIWPSGSAPRLPEA
jgi:rhomboid family GlyGly-CTERM serine protease